MSRSIECDNHPYGNYYVSLGSDQEDFMEMAEYIQKFNVTHLLHNIMTNVAHDAVILGLALSNGLLVHGDLPAIHSGMASGRKIKPQI